MFAKAALLVALAMGSAVAHAGSDDFVNFAFVSATIGVSPSRLCFGEPNPTSTNNIALGCPSYAPSLTTGGDVSVTGNLSASKFIGDGSGLTGVASTPDRVVSGTSSIIVSQSGHISFTTAGAERMVINSSGNVGIGTTAPAMALDVAGEVRTSGSSGYGFYVSTTTDAGYWFNNFGLRRDGIYLDRSNDRLVFRRNSNDGLFVINSTGNVGIGTSEPAYSLDIGPSSGKDIRVSSVLTGDWPAIGDGTFAFWGHRGLDQTAGGNYALLQYNDGTTLLNAASGKSIQFKVNNQDKMYLSSNGNVGIGTTAPSATLHVVGTVSVSSNVSVTGNLSANKFIGDGSGLTGVAVASSDRISTSGVASGGTLGMAVASYGTVSFTTGGVEGTSYLDTTGRWVGPGISVTTLNGVSSTNGYFSGNVGVGTSSP